MEANIKGKLHHLHSITTSVKRKLFYGPYEYLTLNDTRRDITEYQIPNAPVEYDNYSYGDEDSTHKDESLARRGAFEQISQDDGADVSENYTSKDDEWNRITHWTLHEFEPYKSYSYHYHNIKHPKNIF